MAESREKARQHSVSAGVLLGPAPRRTKKPVRFLSRRLVAAVTYFWLIVLGTAFTLPFFWLVSTSFKPPERIQRWPPDILPRLSVHLTQNLPNPADNGRRVVIVDRLPGERFRIRPLDAGYRGRRVVHIENLRATEQTRPGLALYNYTRGLVFIPFFQQLRNTLVICVACVIGTMLSCSLVAYGLAKIDWRGRNVVLMIILSTMMLPFQVTMVPLFAVFSRFGWVDTFLPLTVPAFFGNAFYIFLLRQFFLTIPQELEDAAIIDGAGHWSVYARIVLPLSKPALSAFGVIAFLGSWNSFIWPLIVINRPSMKTLPIGLQSLQGFYGDGNWAVLMAGAVIASLPVLTIFLLAQRQFIEGITLTGLKA